MSKVFSKIQQATSTTKSEAIVLVTVASLLCIGSIGSRFFRPDTLHEIETVNRIAELIDSMSAMSAEERQSRTVLYDSSYNATSSAQMYNRPGYSSARHNMQKNVSMSAPRSINIATATEAQFDALPGIGPATAKAIISRRNVRPFRHIDDLLDVKGIGPAKLNKMRAYLTEP